MNNRHTYYLYCTLLSALLFLFNSCGEDSAVSEPESGNSPVKYSLELKGMSFADAPTTGERIIEVETYQFSDGKLYKQQRLTPGQDGKTEISIVDQTRLYCISGISLSAQPGVTTEADFGKKTVESRPGENSAPYFLSAVTDLTTAAGSREVTVMMKHGVARIDLNTSSDGKIRIDEVIMDDVPAATLAFGGSAPEPGNTVTYRKQYSPAFSGREEAIFYVFESSKPVTVTVRGNYDGIPLRIPVRIPAIERNKIYEIEVLNAGATVEGVFEVKDWEEGETVDGKPDTSRRISVSASQSVIPQGVSVDFDHNVISVPAGGVSDMKIAFVADTRIDISSTEGLSDGMTLSDMTVAESSEGIVSSFTVSIPAQTNGRLGYSVFVHLKNALLAGSYDFVEIRVAPSDNQIETVEIGGSVWMAFNARSADLDDQIYPLDGASVEDMYRYNWINTVGGLFQFGRKYMYTPWVGYKPSNNLGNQVQDIPWQSASHMPCPEGYRLPTRAELESMFPTGQTIPGSYTAGNGERITATVHTAEGTLVTPTGVTGSQIYVKFTSEDTGRYLIIPLAGGKGDKSTSNNPSFGRRAVLWTNSNQGCPGGYALAYWLPFEGNESTVIKEQRLQMEAFASVRCVKQ